MYNFSSGSRNNLPGRGHVREASASRIVGGRQTQQAGGRGHSRSTNVNRTRSTSASLPDVLTEPKSSEMTEDTVLFHGLNYVGFSPQRQNNVKNRQLLVDRFKAHFGPEPISVTDLLLELVKRFGESFSFKFLMMTLHWFKCYPVEHCMSGLWGFGEEFCRKKVREIAENIRSFFEEKITLDISMFDPDEVHWLSVDTVTYITQEFRGTPSTKWYDPKSKSSGLKYEYAVPVRHNCCVWKRGPFPPGKHHDKPIFCGAENKDTPREDWDRTALYFQLPEGKKAIADSAYEGIPEKVTVKRYGQDREVTEFIDRAQNRQESYHSRLDSYAILRHRFRHGTSTENKMDLHNLCVEALMVVVHFDLQHRPLWET
ncbi:hypothetical protein ACHAWT_007755 [Skeletonema menzelii]|mmetsp:Transcript_5384/g.8884  ORF Transcript_5384/g.8884 Transcript_5384/m.8884 type:complete len:371 (+) Transcript_5384:2341-3453(+)|eukprot:scaffold26623_cov160-Skeletonema_menzelii.AAC.2